MDKVNGANSQAMPLWNRQKSHRGHYSSVDGALRAHRERISERQNRVEERLSTVRNMQSEFFPSRGASQQPQLQNDQLNISKMEAIRMPEQNLEIPNQTNVSEIPFQPMEMDQIYSDASMASVGENAIGVVQKEMANPEEAPADETPRGSYVDYVV